MANIENDNYSEKMIGLRITDDIRSKISFIANFKKIMSVIGIVLYSLMTFFIYIRPAVRLIPTLLKTDLTFLTVKYFLSMIITIAGTVLLILAFISNYKAGSSFKKSLRENNEKSLKEAYINLYNSSRFLLITYILGIINFGYTLYYIFSLRYLF